MHCPRSSSKIHCEHNRSYVTPTPSPVETFQIGERYASRRSRYSPVLKSRPTRSSRRFMIGDTDPCLNGGRSYDPRRDSGPALRGLVPLIKDELAATDVMHQSSCLRGNRRFFQSGRESLRR